MFERFTEPARRAIFFARYEASQLGSPYIETEHLLLGLWREDHTLRTLLNDPGPASQVRAEIERRIVLSKPTATPIRERLAAAAEVPLSPDSKKVLHFAAEEADRLAQSYVGTEHMILGILRINGSLGAELAKARGLNAEDLREKLAKPPTLASDIVQHRKPSLPALDQFFGALKEHSPDYLMSCFAKNAEMVDVHGNCWSVEEISKNFISPFAPYTKKNCTYLIERTLIYSDDLLVATVLWKNALIASMERVWMHRMTVILVPEGGEWVILSIHATALQP